MFDHPQCSIRVVLSVRSMRSDISSSCRKAPRTPSLALFHRYMRVRLGFVNTGMTRSSVNGLVPACSCHCSQSFSIRYMILGFWKFKAYLAGSVSPSEWAKPLPPYALSLFQWSQISPGDRNETEPPILVTHLPTLKTHPPALNIPQEQPVTASTIQELNRGPTAWW
jgi:hypothetical protein